jgi:hypothetical protein
MRADQWLVGTAEQRPQQHDQVPILLLNMPLKCLLETIQTDASCSAALVPTKRSILAGSGRAAVLQTGMDSQSRPFTREGIA